jgi:hypothetical protein
LTEQDPEAGFSGCRTTLPDSSISILVRDDGPALISELTSLTDASAEERLHTISRSRPGRPSDAREAAAASAADFCAALRQPNITATSDKRRPVAGAFGDAVREMESVADAMTDHGSETAAGIISSLPREEDGEQELAPHIRAVVIGHHRRKIVAQQP